MRNGIRETLNACYRLSAMTLTGVPEAVGRDPITRMFQWSHLMSLINERAPCQKSGLSSFKQSPLRPMAVCRQNFMYIAIKNFYS